jgi:hypothetical protein
MKMLVGKTDGKALILIIEMYKRVTDEFPRASAEN